MAAAGSGVAAAPATAEYERDLLQMSAVAMSAFVRDSASAIGRFETALADGAENVAESLAREDEDEGDDAWRGRCTVRAILVV